MLPRQTDTPPALVAVPLAAQHEFHPARHRPSLDPPHDSSPPPPSGTKDCYDYLGGKNLSKPISLSPDATGYSYYSYMEVGNTFGWGVFRVFTNRASTTASSFEVSSSILAGNNEYVVTLNVSKAYSKYGPKPTEGAQASHEHSKEQYTSIQYWLGSRESCLGVFYAVVHSVQVAKVLGDLIVK